MSGSERAGGGGGHVVGWALAINLVIAALKFAVASVTSSTAMLAEAFHSLADCGNQVFLLVGLRFSGRRPDEEHPFGYAAERYFWSFIAALSIFSVGGALSIYEGGRKLLGIDSEAIESPRWAIAVLGVSLLLESISFVVAFRQFRAGGGGRSLAQRVSEARDPTVLTVLFEDAAALVGLLVALAGILAAASTGNPTWDGLASVVVGFVLVAVAAFLARQSKSLLLLRSVPAADQARIEAIARAARDVIGIVHIRAVHLGPDQVMCGLKLAFNPALDTRALEQRINELEASLRAELPILVRIYVEPGFDERNGNP